ncbi:hypothetical protein CsSME_00013758 [Camellia sinensis var. sinensis]
MAATRLLRTSGPLGLHLPSSSSSSYCSLKNPTLSSTITNRSREGENREKRLGGGGVGEKKPLAAVKAVAATTERVIISEPQTNIGGVGLASDLVIKIANMALLMLKMATKRRPWSLHAQMFIERTIVDCRFFALFAVAGSLLGSVLCFLEGCFLVIESYLQYFHAMSHRSDQGYVVQLLIEAIDMFMVGTAMLVFGMGLHVMFVGSKHGNSSHLPTPSSNLFGLFNLNTLPRWACMESVTQAKSKIGHAVIMILQVGVVEKFRSIPLVTALDLACFGGALLVSSACIFLLSQLSVGGTTPDR